MKKTALLIAAILTWSPLCAANLKFPPPQDFPVPPTERVVLSNGVVVHLVENHELPIFDIRIRFHLSPADEKPPFVFDMFGSMWRGGGTATMKPDVRDGKVEYMAASIEATTDNESAGVSAAGSATPCGRRGQPKAST